MCLTKLFSYTLIFFFSTTYSNIELSVLQNEEKKIVVAKQGDGILKLLRDNGYNPIEDYIDYFIELNKKKIINNNELIAGETYYLPPKTYEDICNKQLYIDSLMANQFKNNKTYENIEPDTAFQEFEIIPDQIENSNKDLISENNEDNDIKFVIAEQGDGIYRLLRNNGYEPTKYINYFIELNKDKIINNNELIVGEKYYLPRKVVYNYNIDKHTLSYAVKMTKKPADKWKNRYSDTIISNKLEGAMIYLISGHGGPDPGAIAVVDGQTISEDEYAYDICMRIAKNIEKLGGIAVMIIKDSIDKIRDCRILSMNTTEYCFPNLIIPKNHMQRLIQRVEAVNKLYQNNRHIKYHRVIEIHLDSRSTRTNLDVFFYHYTYSIAGRRLATHIRNTFNEKYAAHQPNRGYTGTISGRNLYVIRQTMPPAVLIELGNIQNPRDQLRFLDYRNRQALANWITEGIIRDFKTN